MSGGCSWGTRAQGAMLWESLGSPHGCSPFMPRLGWFWVACWGCCSCESTIVTR